MRPISDCEVGIHTPVTYQWFLIQGVSAASAGSTSGSYNITASQLGTMWPTQPHSNHTRDQHTFMGIKYSWNERNHRLFLRHCMFMCSHVILTELLPLFDSENWISDTCCPWITLVINTLSSTYMKLPIQ